MGSRVYIRVDSFGLLYARLAGGKFCCGRVFFLNVNEPVVSSRKVVKGFTDCLAITKGDARIKALVVLLDRCFLDHASSNGRFCGSFTTTSIAFSGVRYTRSFDLYASTIPPSGSWSWYCSAV